METEGSTIVIHPRALGCGIPSKSERSLIVYTYRLDMETEVSTF